MKDTALDLQSIIDIAQLVGTATAIGGTVFALMQLREFRIQRRDAAAGDLMRAFKSAEFANAMAIVRNLSDGIPGEELRARGLETERAATLIL